MKSQGFLDDIFFCTVRIVNTSFEDGSTSVGTGFIFTHDFMSPENPPSPMHSKFLISNRHVFGDPKDTLSLEFHHAGSDLEPDFDLMHRMVLDGFSGAYLDHPDKEIDLACINISSIDAEAPQLFYKFIQESFLSFCSDERLHAGKEVFFVGYPDNRYDTRHHLPILRRGYIASLPQMDFNGEPHFVIDAQVFHGSSGSPVFVHYDDGFKIVGVVTATMIKNELLVPINSIQVVEKQEYGIEQPIGLGIVIKSEALQELIDLAVAKAKSETKYS